MVVVHPAFDPTTKTWFTNEGIEAASLRELKQKIPDVKIVGYYPHGAPPTVWPLMSERQDQACRAIMRSTYTGPKRQREAQQIQARLAQRDTEVDKAPVVSSSQVTKQSLEKLTTDLVNSGQDKAFDAHQYGYDPAW